MKNDIFQRLQHDHRLIKKELADCLKRPFADKTEIDQLCRTYLIHLDREEKMLYPAMAFKTINPELVQENHLAQQETRQLVEMILADHIADLTGREHLELLQLNLENHMALTEKALFPSLKNTLNESEIESLSQSTPNEPDLDNPQAEHRWFSRIFAH